MQAVIEEITASIGIVRVYDDGMEPVNPNPFRYSVVYVRKGPRIEIKALSAGICIAGFKAMARALQPSGASEMWWEHDGVIHTYRLSSANKLRGTTNDPNT